MTEPGTILYFAYGSNMVRAQMAHRCPGATVAGPGILPRHRFLINTFTWATVVADPAQTVHGVLWKLNAQHEASLDYYESVQEGHYVKATIEVVAGESGVVRAMTYFATDSNPGRPSPHYIQGILNSALEFAFPDAYLMELRRWHPGEASG